MRLKTMEKETKKGGECCKNVTELFYTHAKTGRLKYLRKIQGWTILENIYWKYILKIYVRFKSSRRIIFFSSSHPLPFSISPLCIFVYSAPLLPASRLWSLSLEEQPTPSLIRPPTIHEVIGRCETLRETRRKTLCRGSAVDDRACCLLDAWPFKSVADVYMCVCVCVSGYVDATMHWVIRYLSRSFFL